MKREHVDAWLAQRLPSRPAELELQMTHALEQCDVIALEQAPNMSDVMALLGIESLRRVIERRSASQGVAMDLLAADAFVTYAFEATALEGGNVEELMSRLLAEAV